MINILQYMFYIAAMCAVGVVGIMFIVWVSGWGKGAGQNSLDSIRKTED